MEAHGSVEKGMQCVLSVARKTHHVKAGRVVRPFSIGLIWSFFVQIARKPFVQYFQLEFSLKIHARSDGKSKPIWVVINVSRKTISPFINERSFCIYTVSFKVSRFRENFEFF